jgi:hypothetical protein
MDVEDLIKKTKELDDKLLKFLKNEEVDGQIAFFATLDIFCKIAVNNKISKNDLISDVSLAYKFYQDNLND